MKRILVLRHVPHCPLGSAAGILAEAGLAAEHVDLFDSVPRRLPLDEAAGLIILGGPMSANDVDEFPFLATELDWIRKAIAARVPLLGVCLGAQLLAKAMGGRVYRNAVKEIGWYDLELLPPAGDDRLFRGRAAVETVFQWHGDTFDLPPGAIHLARSRQCRHQAFRCGDWAYGLQFHVEMTPQLMDEWLRRPGSDEELGPEDQIDPGAIRRLAPGRFPAMDSLSRCLLGRFAEMCRAG
jgi:GMP synthase-like glutamine amidotransferase